MYVGKTFAKIFPTPLSKSFKNLWASANKANSRFVDRGWRALREAPLRVCALICNKSRIAGRRELVTVKRVNVLATREQRPLQSWRFPANNAATAAPF